VNMLLWFLTIFQISCSLIFSHSHFESSCPKSSLVSFWLFYDEWDKRMDTNVI